MNTTIPDTKENREKIAVFVAQEVEKDKKIPHFDKEAVEIGGEGCSCVGCTALDGVRGEFAGGDSGGEEEVGIGSLRREFAASLVDDDEAFAPAIEFGERDGDDFAGAWVETGGLFHGDGECLGGAGGHYRQGNY